MPGFFADPIDPSRIVAVDARHRRRPSCRRSRRWSSRRESIRGELLALRKEIEAARFSERAADRRRIPEPEIVAGTKSSTLGGGDIGSVLDGARDDSAVRSRPRRARAGARAGRRRPKRGSRRSALALRAEIAALCAPLSSNAARPPNDIGRRRLPAPAQIERIAQVSYDAGERGILELLDAYRTGATARVRQAALDAAVRQAEIELEFVSGWEIP